jgi:hypothetical protein
MQLHVEQVLKYTFIESDLADAIAALPNKSVYAASEKSFKRSSLCFISKSESYQKKWQSRQR